MSTKDTVKKEHEKEILTGFLKTEAGKKWQELYKIIPSSCKPNEPLDFIFQSTEKQTIGLEIVSFIASTKNGQATQHLKTIGNKVLAYANNEYNLTLHMLITPYDYRKFSPKCSDHISYQRNPGFSKKFDEEYLKPKLQEVIDSNLDTLKQGKLVTKWILDPDKESLKIDLNTSIKPYCYVNNAGWCKQNPFDDIQYEIEKKNKKLPKYLEICDECHLLVAIMESEEGSYYWFSKDINENDFTHKFKSLQFYKHHFNLFDLYGVTPKNL